jgi:hypothetical protein
VLTISTYLNAFLLPLMTIGGAVVVVLATMAKYKDRRQQDMKETVDLWQSQAEALKAQCDLKDAKLTLKEAELQHMHERNDYLWSELLKRADLAALERDPGSR